MNSTRVQKNPSVSSFARFLFDLEDLSRGCLREIWLFENFEYLALESFVSEVPTWAHIFKILQMEVGN